MNLVLSSNCNRGNFICAAESTEGLPSSVSFKHIVLDTLDKPLKLSVNSFHKKGSSTETCSGISVCAVADTVFEKTVLCSGF